MCLMKIIYVLKVFQQCSKLKTAAFLLQAEKFNFISPPLPWLENIHPSSSSSLKEKACYFEYFMMHHSRPSPSSSHHDELLETDWEPRRNLQHMAYGLYGNVMNPLDPISSSMGEMEMGRKHSDPSPSKNMHETFPFLSLCLK